MTLSPAELTLERLLEPRPAEGELRLPGGRGLVVDADATYRLAEELEETLGEVAARGVLTRFGFQSGYQEATRLRTYFAWESDVAWLEAGLRAPSALGAGRLALGSWVLDRAQGLFRVEVLATNAWEAAAHKARRGPAPGPVCHRLTGYLTGFGSAFLGDDVLFVERECAGRDDGATGCRFEGRLGDEWGPEGAAHRRLYQRDAIGERLASRDQEVFAQRVTIREQALALEAARRVEEASRLKSEFLANISHELRTPLNSIIGYADILLAKLGPKLPPAPRGNLERILGNAEHLLGLLNQVLDISKIEAGRLELRLEPVEPRPLLSRCLEDARVLARGKPVEVVDRSAGRALPPVRADETRLRQCLTNVLSNAVKFTERGEVALDARVISGARSGHAHGFLALSVRDTGPGIAPEHQALVFEPFRQVDTSSRRQHEGTGLGLAIVRQLLEHMGGEVRLQSAPGAGSTFTLVVPLAGAGEPEAASDDGGAPGAPRADDPPGAGAGSPAGEPLEVLLIDDDPDAEALVRQALELALAPAPAARVRLHVERDPVEGLAVARARPPALVLLDLALPSVDGRQVLRLLRDDPRTCGVPVVVVSVRDDAASTLAEGAQAVLPKPVSPEALRGALDLTLAARPAAGGPPPGPAQAAPP